jgi:hypothetical protein
MVLSVVSEGVTSAKTFAGEKGGDREMVGIYAGVAFAAVAALLFGRADRKSCRRQSRRR